MARWHVVIAYRSGLKGTRHVVRDIEELAELQDLIESGPDWRTLEGIHITYAGLPEKLTEEQVEEEASVATEAGHG